MLDVCAASVPAVSSDTNNNSNSSSQTASSKGGDANQSKHRQQLTDVSSGSNEEHRLLSYVPLKEKIQRYSNASHDVPFFSVEFFPPRTDKGAANLVQLIDKFRDGDPFFCDITWHAAGISHSSTSSITISGVALNYCFLDAMLHVTCIGLKKADLRDHLEKAKSLGIRNILALRGDKHGEWH